MKIFIFALISYLIGSIPTGLIIGKAFFHKDIREYGSKNLGGTNAGRVLGRKIGILVSFLDIVKVFLPCLIIRYCEGSNIAAITGFCGMLGHCYPIFAGFKGGKGVSSFMGIVAVLDYRVVIICFILWQSLRFITNYVSVASIISCYSAAFIYLYFDGTGTAFYVLFFASIFVTYLHRANIKRLMNGTENKFRNK